MKLLERIVREGQEALELWWRLDGRMPEVNINGRTAWKIEQTGQTHQEWYDEKLKKAGVDENNE